MHRRDLPISLFNLSVSVLDIWLVVISMLLLSLASLLIDRPVIVVISVIGTALVWAHTSKRSFVLMLVSLTVFQNFAICLISPWLEAESVRTLQGANFAFALGGAVVATTVWLADGISKTSVVDKLRIAAMLLLIAIIGYAAYGAREGDATDAIIYLRNFSGPIFMFMIGCYLGNARFVISAILIILIGALIVGYAEILTRPGWYENIGAVYFLRAKFSGFSFDFTSADDVMAYLNVSFLNLPWLGEKGFDTYRLLGPNLHPISFGFSLSLLILLCIASGRRFLAIAGLPPAVLVGAKGALVTLAVSVGALVIWRLSRSERVTVSAVVIALVGMLAAAFAYGIAIGDYHVIGFLGGLDGLRTWPFGHGIGAGGNLSSEFREVNWSDAQRYGVSVAVESAIGVAIYQLGVLAFAWTAFWLATGFAMLRVGARNTDPLALASGAALLATIFVGVLQEESMFSPTALGFYAMLAGAVLMRGDGEVVRSTTPTSMKLQTT